MSDEPPTLPPSGSFDEAVTVPCSAIPPAPEVGEKVRYFGDYELLEEIARGGMGVVFRGRQLGVNRLVALKMILSGQLASPADIRRFQVEAEAAANLDHPNIVPIYEVGDHHGQSYFSMKLIEGGSLSRRIPDLVKDQTTAARLMAQIARAIHHAHQRQILHRDLKPGNILVDQEGQPHITDFGLARKIEGDSKLTNSGAILGTPSYMPPEQASGEKGITTAADVYGLGAILYEMLTGRPPFQGITPLDTLMQVLDRPPPLPRTLNAETDGDLETICLKCLEKEPEQRYESAAALADDLERWLRNEPIQARPPSATYRLRKFVRRNWVSVSASALIALALIVGTVVATWQAVRATRAEGIAQKHASDAELAAEAERDARELAQRERNKALEAQQATAVALERERATSYVHRIALAHREWLANDLIRARQILEACPSDLRHWEWRYLRKLCNSEVFSFRVDGRAGAVMTHSLDGKQMAVASGGDIVIRDPMTGKLLGHFQRKQLVSGLAFHPDGKHLAVLSFNQIEIVDLKGDSRCKFPPHKRGITSIAFRPDGKHLASASAEESGKNLPRGEVRIHDTTTGKEIRRMPDLAHTATTVVYSPDGKYIAAGTGIMWIQSGGEDPNFTRGQIRIWDASDGKVVQTIRGHEYWVTGLHFRPGSQQLASCSADGTARVWDVSSGKEVQVLRGHTGWVRGVAFDPMGKQLVTVGDDRLIRQWDANSGKETGVIRGHTGTIQAVGFTSGGRRLVTIGQLTRDINEVRVWDPGVDQQARTYMEMAAGVNHVAFHPDNTRMAWSGWKGAMIAPISGGSAPVELNGVRGIAFSPDGRILTTAGFSEQGVVLRNAEDRSVIRRLEARFHPYKDAFCTFSPDGQRLAAITEDGLRLWNPASGQVLHTFQPHRVYFHRIAFSPDGARFATISSLGHVEEKIDGKAKTVTYPPELKIWDTATAELILTLKGEGQALAYNPTGTRLVSSAENNTAVVWDANNGKPILTLRGHTEPVTRATFSPDGKRIVTGSSDTSVKLWDAQTGQELMTLRGHRHEIDGVAFSPDGRYLLTGSTLLPSPVR